MLDVDVDLAAKFPGLRPGRSTPPAYHVLGFGLYLYGERDFDEETGSFVRTLCFCVLYVPLVALRAYRTAPAERGWTFLGREPLSKPAGVASVLALLLIFGGGGSYGVRKYTTSPSYVARHKMAEAGRLGGAGRVGDAAKLYAEVAVGPTEEAAPATQRLAALFDHPAAKQDLEALGAVFHSAVEVQKAGRWQEPQETLYGGGLALAKGSAATNPRGALAILEAVAPLAPQGEDPAELRHDLLEKVVAAEPTDPELASRLAVDLESRGQPDRCESILEPVRGRLGEREGARILGLIDAKAGRVDPSLALLRPYAQGRLDRLGNAEARLRSAFQAAQNRVLDRLRNSSATDFNYDFYRASDEAGRQTMLVKYVEEKMKDDPEVAQAREGLLAEAKVVPIALEIGMLLLQRAQSKTDPQARKADLDDAEAAFLAVSRLAGDSAEYRLSLGQVYYWQGKHSRGRALFDEVLKAHNRSPELLLQVAMMLRNVGSISEARSLAEEGYHAATDAKVKSACAVTVGLLGVDIDDRILWLRRASTEDPSVKAMLAGDLASQALGQGNEAGAIGHLREAIALFESMPETASSLNNGSLALMQLATLTGDEAAHRRAAEMIEKAVGLGPGNSLTMSNAASSLLEASLRDIIASSIDLKLLRRRASIDLLEFLARDDADRQAFAGRLRAHPGMNRALAMMDKVILLAPRNADSYEAPLSVVAYLRDVEGLRKLGSRLEGIELDLADKKKNVEELDSGRKDQELVTQSRATLPRAEAILKQARAAGGPTFAAAATSVIKARTAGPVSAIKADLDAVVALAKEAHAASPSLASGMTLQHALFVRAVNRAARARPDLAPSLDRFSRSSSSGELIAASVSADGRLKDVFLADDDVKHAIDLVRESCSASPAWSSGGRSWALLRAKYPDEAAAMARSFLGDEPRRLEAGITAILEPFSPASALAAYWRARMEGKEDDALAILGGARARGVPIPIEAPRPP